MTCWGIATVGGVTLFLVTVLGAAWIWSQTQDLMWVAGWLCAGAGLLGLLGLAMLVHWIYECTHEHTWVRFTTTPPSPAESPRGGATYDTTCVEPNYQTPPYPYTSTSRAIPIPPPPSHC